MASILRRVPEVRPCSASCQLALRKNRGNSFPRYEVRSRKVEHHGGYTILKPST